LNVLAHRFLEKDIYLFRSLIMLNGSVKNLSHILGKRGDRFGFLIDKSLQADGNTVYAAAKELTAEHAEAAEKKRDD
jgi:hypothetical protein